MKSEKTGLAVGGPSRALGQAFEERQPDGDGSRAAQEGSPVDDGTVHDKALRVQSAPPARVLKASCFTRSSITCFTDPLPDLLVADNLRDERNVRLDHVALQPEARQFLRVAKVGLIFGGQDLHQLRSVFVGLDAVGELVRRAAVDGQCGRRSSRLAILAHAVEVLEGEAQRVDHLVVTQEAAAGRVRVDALPVGLPGHAAAEAAGFPAGGPSAAHRTSRFMLTPR